MFLKSMRSTSALASFLKTLRNRKKIALSRVSRIQEFSTADVSQEEKSFNFGASYTEEQQDTILKKINTSSIDELRSFRITEAKLKKLIAYRHKYGPFKSISEVLLLQGIDISILDKFCKSIVKKDSAPKNKSINIKGNLLIPPLDDDVRTLMDTFTGIWVYGTVISWAQVDAGLNLLQWECESVEDVTMKDGVVALVETVASVVSKVPVSHAYIMESDPIIPFTRMNSVAYYLQLQRQQIVSTIVSLLGTRERRFEGSDESDTVINNIYMMRSRTPARLFNLLIGSEIVSAKAVAEKIIDGDNDDAIIHIHADSAVKESYKLRNIYQREQMNCALLLTSAFIELSILRNSHLKKVDKKPKEKQQLDNCTINK